MQTQYGRLHEAIIGELEGFEVKSENDLQQLDVLARLTTIFLIDLSKENRMALYATFSDVIKNIEEPKIGYHLKRLLTLL